MNVAIDETKVKLNMESSNSGKQIHTGSETNRHLQKASIRMTYQRLNIYSLLLPLLTLCTFPSAVESACYTLRVTGAYDYSYSDINDVYYLLSGYCNYYNVWADDYQYDGRYLHYLAFKPDYQVPGTNNTADAWVIRSYGCTDSSAVIYAYSLSYYTSPIYNYEWYQWNPNSDTFDRNYNMYVECYYPALSAWAIVGIVIGSLCGLALLIAIVACVCSKHKQRKNRTQAPQRQVPPPPDAVYITTNDYVTTIGVGGTQPGHVIDPIYSTPINPPAYDNSPPPAYSK